MLDRSARFAGAGGIGLPFVTLNTDGNTALAECKLKVVVAGGHRKIRNQVAVELLPDTPTWVKRSSSLYLTRREAGIPGKSAQESAAIRTAECQKACEILKAKPVLPSPGLKWNKLPTPFI